MKAHWRKSAERKPIMSATDESGSDTDGQDDIRFDPEWYLSTSRSTSKRNRRITMVFLAVVFVAILGGLMYYYFSRKAQEYENVISEETEHVKVDIQGGLVSGRYEDGAIVFQGIPYGVPPVNKLRWNHPVPCDRNMCWNGTFNASRFGNICAQQDVLNVTGDPKKVIGSEDCLFVNVWTPKKRPSKKLLPVLVYIHGGFLLYSSGDFKGIHPTSEMVSEMNIVGVSFNYRLNAFGFLALKSLADVSHANTSGNYGFMDQILALKWVQTNIEKFGGDLGSVTLMGQSSGGTSQLALLASPKAAGLFHRAIIMSPSTIFNKSWENAAMDNKIFVKNAKCERENVTAERECLHSLSPKKIQDAIPWEVYPYWRMADAMDLPTKNRFDGALALVDNYVVLDPPLIAMKTGQANDVPLIIGSTAQEIDLQPTSTQSTWEEYSGYVHKKLDPFLGEDDVSKVLLMYNKTLPDNISAPVQFAYTSMVSDLRANCPINMLALNASIGLKSPVYRYVVTSSPSKPVDVVGYPATFAFHMWDLIAFFGFPNQLDYTPSERDKSFMKNLRREFGEFIHKGTVRKESWKEYPNHTTLFTKDGVKVKEAYHKEECDFWLSRGFFSYAWIN